MDFFSGDLPDPFRIGYEEDDLMPDYCTPPSDMTKQFEEEDQLTLSFEYPQASSIVGCIYRALTVHAHRACGRTNCEIGNKKPKTAFDNQTLSTLREWVSEHGPYATQKDVNHLALLCGITNKQIRTWLSNYRQRKLTPTLRKKVHNQNRE